MSLRQAASKCWICSQPSSHFCPALNQTLCSNCRLTFTLKTHRLTQSSSIVVQSINVLQNILKIMTQNYQKYNLHLICPHLLNELAPYQRRLKELQAKVQAISTLNKSKRPVEELSCLHSLLRELHKELYKSQVMHDYKTSIIQMDFRFNLIEIEQREGDKLKLYEQGEIEIKEEFNELDAIKAKDESIFYGTDSEFLDDREIIEGIESEQIRGLENIHKLEKDELNKLNELKREKIELKDKVIDLIRENHNLTKLNDELKKRNNHAKAYNINDNSFSPENAISKDKNEAHKDSSGTDYEVDVKHNVDSNTESNEKSSAESEKIVIKEKKCKLIKKISRIIDIISNSQNITIFLMIIFILILLWMLFSGMIPNTNKGDQLIIDNRENFNYVINNNPSLIKNNIPIAEEAKVVPSKIEESIHTLIEDHKIDDVKPQETDKHHTTEKDVLETIKNEATEAVHNIKAKVDDYMQDKNVKEKVNEGVNEGVKKLGEKIGLRRGK